MKLTEKNKKYIDQLSDYEILRRWRFSPTGDPWFTGETAEYWDIKIEKLIGGGNFAVISKQVGFEISDEQKKRDIERVSKELKSKGSLNG